jgi:hypothetical protein
MRRLFMTWLALLIFAALAGSASAAPAVWTLQGVVFNDGGTATGSFSYDPITDTFSDVDVTTTAGSLLPGVTYNFAHPLSFDPVVIFLTVDSASDQTGKPFLELVFNPGLHHFGVQDVAFNSGEATCGNSICTEFDVTAPVRIVTAGVAVTSAGIPTLSFWGTLLFVLSLLALGTWQLARRRDRRLRTA